jgi:hypothetical protein
MAAPTRRRRRTMGLVGVLAEFIADFAVRWQDLRGG